MEEGRARELLARERDRIERALAELAGSKHREEQRDAAEDTAALLDEGIAERLRSELAAVERAEQRLAEGSYGRSIESGEPIPDGRLEAIPWAERTADEQQRYERGR